jgi:hypothetical protein
MKPDFPIFKPSYPLRTRLIVLLPTVLFFGMLFNIAFSTVRIPLVFWLFVLVVGLYTSLIPFFIIREVRFPNEMVVRRHFLPDQFFSYKEFEQINPDSIQAGGQRIRIGPVDNLDELKEMAQRWKSARILKESQQPQPGIKSFYPQRGYGMYGSFWGLMFGVIVMLMDLPWLPFDPRWVLAGTFLVVYMVYMHIVPRLL